MESCTCGSPSVLLRCLHSDPVCPPLRTPQRPHVIHLRRRHPCDLPGAAPSGPLLPCACCLLFSRCPAHSAILASRPCTGPSCRLQCSHGSCLTSFKALLTCPLLERCTPTTGVFCGGRSAPSLPALPCSPRHSRSSAHSVRSFSSRTGAP